MSFQFSKYHALGNDYLVVESARLSPAQARLLCHRQFGVGSDGVLLPQTPEIAVNGQPIFGVKILNPDGSLAEKSGNGLRIFTRYLWENGLIAQEPANILTDGGLVRGQILADGLVQVEMGQVQILEELHLTLPDGQIANGWRVEIGNPHFVVINLPCTAETAREVGTFLENHPTFPRRTNVQFLQVLDRTSIQIQIWERGAGYTLASGSSSCAAAAVAHHLGGCEPVMQVHMPGGSLQVSLSADGNATQSGSVVPVCRGEWFDVA